MHWDRMPGDSFCFCRTTYYCTFSGELTYLNACPWGTDRGWSHARFAAFIFFRMLFSFVCMKYMEVLSFSPTNVYKKIYHEVSLQYFYNALLKSVTLTTSDVYIRYIFYTRCFFLHRTSECAKLEQRNEMPELEYWHIATTG